MALWGLTVALRLAKKNLLFLSLFFASFIFVFYPYRFFSAEGYFPIILLSALALDNLYNKLKKERIHGITLVLFFIFVLSPTISMQGSSGKINYKLTIAHSAFTGMIFPMDEARGFSNSVWFPDDYLSAASIIRNNSESGDIVYSSINILGPAFASISGYATSNALFPEIKASQGFDPLAVAKIIVMAKDEDHLLVKNIVCNYKLKKIAENRAFVFYKNPSSHAKVNIRRASVSFAAIIFIGLFYIVLFWRAKYGHTNKKPPNF